MKLRFRDGRTHERTDGRTDGDIEALADAMRALKNSVSLFLGLVHKLKTGDLKSTQNGINIFF